MKNYVLNMWKDYCTLMGSSVQWMKTYWLGYTVFCAVVFGVSFTYGWFRYEREYK